MGYTYEWERELETECEDRQRESDDLQDREVDDKAYERNRVGSRARSLNEGTTA
jgi:hypothetical protein